MDKCVSRFGKQTKTKKQVSRPHCGIHPAAACMRLVRCARAHHMQSIQFCIKIGSASGTLTVHTFALAGCTKMRLRVCVLLYAGAWHDGMTELPPQHRHECKAHTM